MKKLRIHYLQHVPFEDLGCIENWVTQKAHVLTSTKFYETPILPQLTEFDWLIVLGGPMGVYDEDKFDWLKTEKEFVRNSIQAGKTVLGICLGAQLIASALGARVFQNTDKEIGWFLISPVLESRQLLLSEQNADLYPVFHWHGDTFDLPEGAMRLASSEACLNQAFRIGENVIGLQFHFEVTEKSIQRLIAFCSDELVAARYVQSAEMMLEKTQHVTEINKRMFRLLDNLESKTKA